MTKPLPSPLPSRDGIQPSYAWLPDGQWPDLLAWLLERFPHLERGVLEDRLARGEIVDELGRVMAADTPYRPGSRIWYYREVPPETPVPFEEVILHRDEHLLVVDKPHFLATVPGGRYLRETLLARLRNKLDLPELTPIHRLDRETAGLVLFCIHPPSRGKYQALFEQRTVQKVYEAIAPFRADLELPRVHRSLLQEGSRNGERFFTMQEVAGEPNSETRIALMEQRGDLAKYRLEPHTGRKHQLRAHMASLGVPILSDPWYPAVIEDKGDDFSQPLQLLARQVEFVDPISGKTRQFSSRRTLDW
ncbi:MAG TPA: RluA family pseudouridine synthase [Rhodocyclaceae bacterium]|nr:RluA family pseudouridine synthase [Rhodocyclaceae bacterium]